MNNSMKTNINTAGLIGYIISIILIVIMITATVVTVLATCLTAVIPDKGVNVNVSTSIGVEATKEAFDYLNKFVAVDGETAADAEDGSTQVVLASLSEEDLENIDIKADGDTVIIDATANSITLSKGKLMVSLVATVLLMLAVVIMLYMIKALMKALKDCDTPFAENIIATMKRFAYSLIPVVVLSAVTEGLWSAFVSGGNGFEMSLNLGGLLIIAVLFILIMVFTYGAELQRESDETL